MSTMCAAHVCGLCGLAPCSIIMKDRIRAFSGRAEFLIVMLVAFGIFMPGSLMALMAPAALLAQTKGSISTGSLQFLIIYEVVVLVILGAFLRARGWTLERVGLALSWRDTLLGFGLAVALYAVNAVVWLVVTSVLPSMIAAASVVSHLVESSLDTTTVLAVSVVNPVFEEIFVCAYVVGALKERRGIATAVNISAAVRVTYHLYQGAAGVISIVPVGLLFGYVYARTNRLWPLIVAHAVMDLAALMYYRQ